MLFTLTPPVLLDDTTLRAVLSMNCRPRASYRVDLRTGQPTPIRTVPQ